MLKLVHTYPPLLPTHVSPARSALQRVEFMLVEEEKPRRGEKGLDWCCGPSICMPPGSGRPGTAGRAMEG